MLSFRIGSGFKPGKAGSRTAPAPAAELVFAARARARRLDGVKKTTTAIAFLAAPLLALQAQRWIGPISAPASVAASPPPRAGAPTPIPTAPRPHPLEAEIARGKIDFTATSATCAQGCVQPRRSPRAAPKKARAPAASR